MSRTSQERYRAAGLCIFCGQTPREGVLTCERCATRMAKASSLRKAAWHQAGRCLRCGSHVLVTKYHCAVCRQQVNAATKKAAAHIKKVVFEAYGGFVCSCCGETEEVFLSIDHINNDGAEHRRKIGTGNCYRWLRDNNFPAGFQVLCMNCQWGKKLCGVCPHQTRTPL